MTFDVQRADCGFCTYQEVANECPVHGRKALEASWLARQADRWRLRVAQDDALLAATAILHNARKKR